MLGEVTEPNLFNLLGDTCRAERFPLAASEVREGPLRLEAGFYGSDGFRAVQAMRNSGFRLLTIGDAANRIIWFGPFARTYVDGIEHGLPFLTSSTMMEARPVIARCVSRRLTGNLDALTISAGTILLSCSGTIGNVVLCGSEVDGWACSQDAIRIVAEGDALGPVYCYLQSPIGQFLVKRSQSGSVVTHIYADDVAGLPIPLLPKRLRQRLTDLVTQASALRSEANDLLDDAEQYVQSDNGLDAAPACEPQNVSTFAVSSRELARLCATSGSLRVDVNPYQPLVRRTVREITRRPHRRLGDCVEEVIYIGKVFRSFVDDEERGVPLLSGKDLVMIRPRCEKHLSLSNASHIRRCQVKEGWVLVTRSGTVGRVAVCHRNYEGFVASEDILRIVPKERGVSPYYLYAFLSSPYGRIQMLSQLYGSVIVHLSHAQLATIVVPIPGDGGKKIADLVRAAFDKRADATATEDDAFSLFMGAVVEGRSATEATWGGDY